MKTLKEVQEIVGLERRAIQEYEDANVAVKPKTTNKYGHLLYGEKEIERLWQLRFYKEMGYNIPKISEVLNNKDYDIQKELSTVITTLKKKRDNLNNAIAIAEMMKETGTSISSISHSISEIEGLTADALFEIAGTMFNTSNDVWQDDFLNEESVSDEEWNKIFDLADRIQEEFDLGRDSSSTEVQEHIVQAHNTVRNALSESVMFLPVLADLLITKEEIKGMTKHDKKEERLAFVRDAVRHYSGLKQNNTADTKLFSAFTNIESMGRQKYKYTSIEVQTEVEKIHEFFQDIRFLTEEGARGMLRLYRDFLGSERIKVQVDKGTERGIAWFVSKAIEYYSNNLSEAGQ